MDHQSQIFSENFSNISNPRSGEVGTVGLPLFHGSGSLIFEDVKLRFLVIDRLGSDLDKFFKGLFVF